MEIDPLPLNDPDMIPARAEDVVSLPDGMIGGYPGVPAVQEFSLPDLLVPEELLAAFCAVDCYHRFFYAFLAVAIITIRNITITKDDTHRPVPVAPWRMFTRLARIATADAVKMIISLVVYSIEEYMQVNLFPVFGFCRLVFLSESNHLTYNKSCYSQGYSSIIHTGCV